MTDSRYAGTELEVFARAFHWKAYVRSETHAYLTGDVLEVGAGIGAATQALNDGTPSRWVCLEPDPALAARIRTDVLPSLANCEVAVGALSDFDPHRAFNAVLYMDVLEHIKDDAAELARAADRLRPGGSLIVLAPALPWLYTPFDKAIGHYRRYTRKSLRAIAPPSVREEKCAYLDSVGMLASAGNRLLLHSAAPSHAQIRFWDGLLVPASRIADKLLWNCIGRSVLAVWRKAP